MVDKDFKKCKIKIVVLGDINVGKSNIIRRILGGDFQELEATIGVEFGLYEAKGIEENDPSLSLFIQIWDTSGAERYKAITTSHIRNSEGVILVYDVCNEMSFLALDYWYDAIQKCASEDIIIYLLGNKSDLTKANPGMRRVDKERALNFVRKYNIAHWAECSAKENFNIMESFTKFYKAVYMRNRDKLISESKLDEKKMLEIKKKNRKGINSNEKMKCCD